MKEWRYPSSGFTTNAQAAIDRQIAFTVRVATGWRRRVLRHLLSGLLEMPRDGSGVPGQTGGDWKFIVFMLVVPRFLTVFFYAKSGRYLITFSDGNELVVDFVPAAGASS